MTNFTDHLPDDLEEYGRHLAKLINERLTRAVLTGDPGPLHVDTRYTPPVRDPWRDDVLGVGCFLVGFEPGEVQEVQVTCHPWDDTLTFDFKLVDSDWEPSYDVSRWELNCELRADPEWGARIREEERQATDQIRGARATTIVCDEVDWNVGYTGIEGIPSGPVQRVGGRRWGKLAELTRLQDQANRVTASAIRAAECAAYPPIYVTADPARSDSDALAFRYTSEPPFPVPKGTKATRVPYVDRDDGYWLR